MTLEHLLATNLSNQATQHIHNILTREDINNGYVDGNYISLHLHDMYA